MAQLAWQQSADQARSQMRENIKQRRVKILNPRVPERFGRVSEGMWQGYHMALAATSSKQLATVIKSVESELLGFALEGVGMGLTELNWHQTQADNQINRFLLNLEEDNQSSVDQSSAYQTMVYLGVGLMLVRLGHDIQPFHRALSPEKYYPIVDGYGFNHGIFHWQKFVDQQIYPIGLSGYARQVFDQGMGRSLWLINGANPNSIAKTIEAFESSRHQDLWGGVGYACASIGGGDRTLLESLGAAAGAHTRVLAESASCAASYRSQLGNATGYTTLATEIFHGLLKTTEPCLSTTESNHWCHYRRQIAGYAKASV